MTELTPSSEAMSLLSQLVKPLRTPIELSSRIDVAVAIVVDSSEWPPEVAAAIGTFLRNPDAANLAGIRKAVVLARITEVGPELFVKLVSEFATKREITLSEAACLLTLIRYPIRDALSLKCRKVIEIAELAAEDEHEGFRRVQDDDLLLVALRDIVEEQDG